MSPVFVFEKDIFVVEKYLVWKVVLLVFAVEGVRVSGRRVLMWVLEDRSDLRERKRFIVM